MRLHCDEGKAWLLSGPPQAAAVAAGDRRVIGCGDSDGASVPCYFHIVHITPFITQPSRPSLCACVQKEICGVCTCVTTMGGSSTVWTSGLLLRALLRELPAKCHPIAYVPVTRPYNKNALFGSRNLLGHLVTFLPLEDWLVARSLLGFPQPHGRAAPRAIGPATRRPSVRGESNWLSLGVDDAHKKTPVSP